MIVNLLEREIDRLDIRLRKICEKPDPTKLKSNKLLYALQLDLRKAQLAAWTEKRKPIALSSEWLEPLLRSLGFQPLDYQDLADRVGDASTYLKDVRAIGFSEDSCDRVTLYLTLCKKGELPTPDFIPIRFWGCDMIYQSQVALAHMLGVPYFVSDHGMEWDEPNLQYVTNQLQEMINYVECTIPGIRFDDTKLAELVEADTAALQYLREIYQLRKCVPSPTTVEDTFRIPRFPSHYEDAGRALDYIRLYYEEVTERAKKMQKTEEKLRVMWIMTAPFYARLFEILESKSARVTLFALPEIIRFYGQGYFYGDQTQFGRKLTPLEEVARTYMLSTGTYGQRWIDEIIWACKDLNINAIVNFVQVGCNPTYSLAGMIIEKVKQDLEIPVLNLEGRQLYSELCDSRQLIEKLDEFIDMCLESKAAPFS